MLFWWSKVPDLPFKQYNILPPDCDQPNAKYSFKQGDTPCIIFDKEFET